MKRNIIKVRKFKNWKNEFVGDKLIEEYLVSKLSFSRILYFSKEKNLKNRLGLGLFEILNKIKIQNKI